MTQRWEVVRLARSLGDWAPLWDDLNARLHVAHPLLDSRFVDALLQHFGDGSEYLCIDRSQPAEAPSGMLILRPGRAGHWLSFCPSQAQISPTLLVDGTLLTELFSCLPGRAFVIDLLNLDPSYQLPQLPGDMAHRVMDHAVTINVRAVGGFESYWRERSNKLMQNVRRYGKRLHTQGIEPVFRLIEQPAEMPAALFRFGELESAGWKGKEGTAVHGDNTQGAFYRDLLQHFARTGQATVCEYWFGQRLAASRLRLAGPAMSVMLKTSYDENLAEFAPGQLLLQRLLQHEFGLLESHDVEFYTNASKEQLAWATGHRSIRHVTVYRTAWLLALHDGLKLARQWLQPVRVQPHEAAGHNTIRVSERANFEALSAAERQRLQQAETHCLDLGLAWYQNFSATITQEHASGCLLVAEAGGALQSLLPLRLMRSPGRCEAHAWANFYTWLYAPLLAPLASDATLASMLNYLAARAEAPALLRLAPMDPEAASFALIERGMRRAGWLPFRYFCFGNWYFERQGQSWQDYLASRPGELRSTLNRKGKRFLAADGQLEVICGNDDLEAAIAAYQAIYAASWKRPEPYPEFIPGLIRTAAAKGWLRLGIARLGQQPIAAQIWLVAHGTANIYKLAYDETQDSYSAGSLLTAHLMQHVIEQDAVEVVDFLSGDDPYKTQWMSARRERWGLVAYNPRTLQGVLGWLRELLGRGLRRYWRRAQDKSGH